MSLSFSLFSSSTQMSFFLVYRSVISVIVGYVKSVGVPKCFQKLFNILVSFTFA